MDEIGVIFFTDPKQTPNRPKTDPSAPQKLVDSLTC